MTTVDTRRNSSPEMPTTMVHEARTLFFGGDDDPAPIVAKWTIEYQPDDTIVTEAAIEDLLPHSCDITPENAAQYVYKNLKASLFPDSDSPPLVVTLDYERGEGLYENYTDYTNQVSVGSFH